MANDKSNQSPDYRKLAEIKRKNASKNEKGTGVPVPKENYLGTILGIIRLIEGVDPYTAVHERRVAQLARAIAEEMGLDDEQVKSIEVAAFLHDIRWDSMPQSITAFPGRISQEEKNILRTQPQMAYDVLKELDLPPNIAEIVLQHHERMDGSGYPNGLSGEAILPEARILAVADVVEAMCSNRSYRSALGAERALDEISKNKDTLYDAGVVSACTNVFNKNRFTFI
jgi:HD-GYP domain-containing protein (c-di-GMP phosphodiesterase class II)